MSDERWNLFTTRPLRLERAGSAPAKALSPHQLYEQRKAEFFAQQSGQPVAPVPAARLSAHELYEARKAEFYAERPWLGVAL